LGEPDRTFPRSGGVTERLRGRMATL